MSGFFGFFEQNSTGILVFMLFLAGIAVLVQWVVWIFGVGRFKAGTVGSGSTLRYIFAEFFGKIIDQFRHLLALIVVLIFAVALAYAMIKSQQGTLPEGATSVSQMSDTLTAIMSTLGGLVGLILGYYFGESTVTQVVETVEEEEAPDPVEPQVQEITAADDIDEAPQPDIDDSDDAVG